MKRVVITLWVLVAVLAAAAYADYLRSKREDNVAWADEVTGGNRSAAPLLMARNGCGGCHTIPGVPGATGTTGPALSGLAQRGYIAGSFRNSPDQLVNWIRHARDMKPGTAMPNTNVSEQDARDIAAFLYDPCRSGLLTGKCL